MEAKDCKCCKCGKQAVAFYPCVDPDIPSYPYCAAFRSLITKMMGRKTWDANPWVWVYEFELVK